MARKALGKGIDALIPAVPKELKGEAVTIPIKLITDNPYQPRRISGQEVSELTASIREHGVLQPLIVRKYGKAYQLVVGSRRLKAAQLAGLAEVPVVVRKATDHEMLALALVENLQRSDLNPVEAALAYKRLVDEFGMTQGKVARVIGKDRSTVANTMRLLSLPRKARTLLEQGKITEGHARALLQVSSASLVEKLSERIVAEGLTVREVERLARSAEKVSAPKPRKQRDGVTVAAEEMLSEKLGVRVKVIRGRKGGRIEIRYANEKELSRLLEWFRSR